MIEGEDEGGQSVRFSFWNSSKFPFSNYNKKFSKLQNFIHEIIQDNYFYHRGKTRVHIIP